MKGSLIGGLIESHRVERGRSRGEEPRVSLRVDHVVAEGTAAALVFRLFEGLERDAVEPELVLACAEENAVGRFAAAAEQVEVEKAAGRYAAVFSRFGNGPSHQVYVARFAAPGKLVLGTRRSVSACGALGSLGFTASAAEVAAVLSGSPLEVESPSVVSVHLLGTPPRWVGGVDLLLELHRRQIARRVPGALLEFSFSEPGGLPWADRLAIARNCPALGARAAVFPSDERARAFLRAQGREADWKPMAGVPVGEGAARVVLDASDLEPLVLRPSDGGVSRVRELAGSPVEAVWIGSEVAVPDLVRFVRRLGDRGVRPGVDVRVAVASRQMYETLGGLGLIGRLRAAGARVGMEASRAWGPGPGPGIALVCGTGWDDAGGREGHVRRFVASIETCAASALEGALADPRSLPRPAEEAEWEVESYAVRDRLQGRPAARAERSRAGRPGRAPGPGDQEPVRMVVLLKVGDQVGAEEILPAGGRARSLRRDHRALAADAFRGLDPGFAGRARLHGGGCLVAGRRLGAGAEREDAVHVLGHLGLRAVLALSYDQDFRRLLVLQGILALRFAGERDYRSVSPGDELEMPDLPEGLEAGKPLVARNLTQGGQYALLHDLEAAEIPRLRAGGLLAEARLGARTR